MTTSKRIWRILRTWFRGFRIALWLVLLFCAGSLVYLNRVGLPDFAKGTLIDKLRARGLELEFSRLHLSFAHGIVAEDVRLGRAVAPPSPQITFAEVRLGLNYRALLHRQFQIESLALRQGRLVWPLGQAGSSARELTLDNIQTDLSFLPGDEWALDHFRASFAGAKLQLSGTVRHASAIKDWKLFSAEAPAVEPNRLQQRLRQLADTLARIQLPAPPELRLDVRGDARELNSFEVRLLASAQGATTPWGRLDHGQVAVRLFPTASNGLSRAEVTIEAASAQTPWADATRFHLAIHGRSDEHLGSLVGADFNLTAARATTPWATANDVQLQAHIAPIQNQTNTLQADLSLRLGRTETQWATGGLTRFTAQWVHVLTNPIPVSGHGRLNGGPIQTPWGRADELEFLVHLASPDSSYGTPEPFRPGSLTPNLSEPWLALAWLTNLTRHPMDWECRFHKCQLPQVNLEEIVCAGSWRAPSVWVTNLLTRFDQGALDVRAGLNTATRTLHATVSSDVDPNKLAPFLPENTKRWLAPLTWKQPPILALDATLLLPPWTNRQPDWQGQIVPTLDLRGDFNVPQGGTYRGVSVGSARGHFTYSNQCWRLPELVMVRPEGRVTAAGWADERSRDFFCRLSGSVDPQTFQPWFAHDAQDALALFSLSLPPDFQAELSGRFDQPASIQMRGHVEMTNFSFRGESVSGFQTDIGYSNRSIQLSQTRLQRGEERLSADGLNLDFQERVIHLTNGYSTTDPMVVARAIGPHIVRAIAPFCFSNSPTARVNGTIPLEGEDKADLYFQIEGGPFHWSNFNVPRISGRVHWQGLHLTLKDVGMDFYDGTAAGSAAFYFPRDRPGTQYQFTLTTTNFLLQRLMADLFKRTNHLEGRMSGLLVVTNADSEDWRQTGGYGMAKLQNGLIWDIPLFGVLSPTLDSLIPGLGSVRASSASAEFAIYRGVIRSDDLEIRSPVMRMRYAGTTDLEGKVNARVEAELLRDMPLLGALVTTVFWPAQKLFVHKITGDLANPKIEPVFVVSKILLMPFHPLRTLKGLLPEEGASSRNDAPGVAP